MTSASEANGFLPVDVIRDEREVLPLADLLRVEPVSVGQDDDLGAGSPQRLRKRRQSRVERHFANDPAELLFVAVRDQVPLPLKALAAADGTAEP